MVQKNCENDETNAVNAQNHQGDTIVYAIGDIHGESERLAQLHDTIFERHQILYPHANLQLIHLGDYVDRGPDSAGVLERLMQLSKSDELHSVALAGNHEAMMLAALANEAASDYKHWLRNGGEQTLQSYADRGFSGVPDVHIEWIRNLPTILINEAERRIFVHAGLRPESFPHESSEVHLWTRSADFFNTHCWQGTQLQGWTVIHGHTPTESGWPDDLGDINRRINIDTGAVFGGRLTCAVIAPGETIRYLYA